MPLSTLPTEILLLIAEAVEAPRDLNSFIKVDRHLYNLLSDVLYKQNIRYSSCSALAWAAQHDRVDTIKRILALGAPVDGPDTRKEPTPLELAACEGKADAVRFLVSRGAALRVFRELPPVALCAAAAGGHTDVVRVLLEWRAKFPIKNRNEDADREFPARHLPPSGSWNILLQLIAGLKGSAGDDERTHNSLLLLLAIGGAHDGTAEYLIQHTTLDIDYQDCNRRTPLLWAVSHGRDSVISCLLDHGADPNHEDIHNYTVLQKVIIEGNTRAARLLLKHKAVDPNYERNPYSSPLGLALRKSNTSIIQALVARPELDLTRQVMPGGFTPLQLAVHGRDPEIVEILLSHAHIRDVINNRGGDGRTALFQAAQGGPVELVDLLLAKGADPTLEDAESRTALSVAAEHGNREAFTRLSRYSNVPLDTKDRQGLTPLFWACGGGHPALVEYLLELGADPNTPADNGDTPLAYLVRSSARSMFNSDRRTRRLLLDAGADPFAEDAMGHSVISLALKSGNQSLYKELIDHVVAVGGKSKLSKTLQRNSPPKGASGFEGGLGQHAITT